MTKLKRSLKNLARAGLLLKFTIILTCFFSGCTSSTCPTYLKENIASSIVDLCRNEYKINVTSKLVGETLWIYFPVEDFFIADDKPEKYTEKFAIEEAKGEFAFGAFRVDYKISSVPEGQEITPKIKYNREIQQKMGQVLNVLRRVIFSLDCRKEKEPKFYCMVTADIKTGMELRELIYYSDLKKVSYGLISLEEYYHRVVNETNAAVEILNDLEGTHLKYKDWAMEEFITSQIQQRIRLAFEREIKEKKIDIDKEILKIAVSTIKIYDFKDFSALDLNNLITNARVVLNQRAVWEEPALNK